MKTAFVALSLFCSSVAALGQNATVTTSSAAGLLQLAGSGQDNQILVSANDFWGVLRAAEDLAGDIGKVVGKNLTLGNWLATSGNSSKRSTKEDISKRVVQNAGSPSPHGPWGGSPSGGPWGGHNGGNPPESDGHNSTKVQGGETTVYYTFNPTTNFINVSSPCPTWQVTKQTANIFKYTVGPAENFTGPTLQNNSKSKTVIIAGTIGKSDVINALISSGKLITKPIQGRWESYISEIITNPLPGIDKALVIAGSDLRGTVYGLYDISEQIGVSPLWWWTDIPVKKQAGVWALETQKVQGPPSVKYRGFFINDEQPALTNWIK